MKEDKSFIAINSYVVKAILKDLKIRVKVTKRVAV